MSIRIGIAGYMGSGKSTCVQILSNSKVIIVDADREAKRLMDSDLSIKNALLEQFGESIYEQNSISFAKLGNIAFDSLDNLRKLNAVVHPYLLRDLSEKMEKIYKNNNCAFLIMDAALIPLWNVELWFDKLIWIQSSRENRLSRLLQKYKTKTDKEKLLKRMDLQEQLFSPPVADSWIIIENDSSIDELRKKVNDLLTIFN